MYEVIGELPNWLKAVRNEEWNYNFINKEWRLASDI